MWRGEGMQKPSAPHKSGLHVLLVANPKGIAHYNEAREGLLGHHLDKLGISAGKATPTHPAPGVDDTQTGAKQSRWLRRTTYQFKQRAQQTARTTVARDTAPLADPGSAASQSLRAEFPTRLSKAHGKGRCLYVDGSKREDEDGNTQLGAAMANNGQVTYIDQSAALGTPVATILRCESSAIKTALKLHPEEEELHIYTDSLVSLYLIKRAIMDPKRLHVSKYRHMFAEITELLEKRSLNGLKTLLHKVKSHCADTPAGNTTMDEHAGLIAMGLVEPTVAEDAVTAPFDDELFWVRAAAGAEHFASDLNRGLKKIVQPLTQNGYTNDTIYTDLWEKAAQDLDPKLSNEIMTDSHIPWKDAHISFKYRAFSPGWPDVKE
ncbi:hypothetical protein TSOC_004040 [Tetrabaena socialis]|uniref:RNase H type-1 domain-containing protein n=1 Tax=Tetrabaena socialis TaxID=47790 RepID=A0A2J8AA44_9CHLO|nr:hypothetical protein TSOC_004040 [Tetrabaena socialis]|eukprot:PNH09353.1 hypothetical protein TSOC_004040 [Tetrabaena socialis]